MSPKRCYVRAQKCARKQWRNLLRHCVELLQLFNRGYEGILRTYLQRIWNAQLIRISKQRSDAVAQGLEG